VVEKQGEGFRPRERGKGGGPLSLGLIPAFKRRLRCGIKMKILKWIGTHGQLSFVRVFFLLHFREPIMRGAKEEDVTYCTTIGFFP